jgi:hypothetical protein
VLLKLTKMPRTAAPAPFVNAPWLIKRLGPEPELIAVDPEPVNVIAPPTSLLSVAPAVKYKRPFAPVTAIAPWLMSVPPVRTNSPAMLEAPVSVNTPEPLKLPPFVTVKLPIDTAFALLTTPPPLVVSVLMVWAELSFNSPLRFTAPAVNMPIEALDATLSVPKETAMRPAPATEAVLASDRLPSKARSEPEATL